MLFQRKLVCPPVQWVKAHAQKRFRRGALSTSIPKRYTFFYKKLGSGHSTKSFLISHEILSILVQNVS